MSRRPTHPFKLDKAVLQASDTLDPDQKAAFRRRAKARRAALERASGDFAPAVLALLSERSPGVIAGYLPIGDEADPAAALDALAGKDWRRAMPCTQPDRPLVFRAWAPGDPVIEGRHGVREPSPHAPALRPDALLIPMLAFDRAGGRLGWGGGYYDRTLAALRADAPIFAIGLAWAGQEVAACPWEPHDAPLDAIATEREAIVIARSAA